MAGEEKQDKPRDNPDDRRSSTGPSTPLNPQATVFTYNYAAQQDTDFRPPTGPRNRGHNYRGRGGNQPGGFPRPPRPMHPGQHEPPHPTMYPPYYHPPPRFGPMNDPHGPPPEPIFTDSPGIPHSGPPPQFLPMNMNEQGPQQEYMGPEHPHTGPNPHQYPRDARYPERPASRDNETLTTPPSVRHSSTMTDEMVQAQYELEQEDARGFGSEDDSTYVPGIRYQSVRRESRRGNSPR
ncbi:hypothetical protein F4808DRAFT_461805 [Astrocystis sublimbata]|nr:hypothetical protein F4808DRAFT_461805 [Astrocystis sublimbata]